jgi:hypothetical protein
MKPVVALLLALAAGGCAKQPVALYMDTQMGGETGHYVLVAAKSTGMMKVYDCLVRPDDGEWNPTCVKVDLTNTPPRSSSEP